MHSVHTPRVCFRAIPDGMITTTTKTTIHDTASFHLHRIDLFPINEKDFPIRIKKPH